MIDKDAVQEAVYTAEAEEGRQTVALSASNVAAIVLSFLAELPEAATVAEVIAILKRLEP